MSRDHREYGRRFAEWLEALPKETRDEIHRQQREDSDRAYADFKAALAEDQCFMCNDPLGSFEERKPCIHWLLKPEGFRKKHFNDVIEHFGMFQIQSYLRWFANEDGFARHITDNGNLKGDGHLVEVTIRYRDLEWSMSCGQGDYAGHANANKGTWPHYHFQMRVNRRPFINYNDFHVPLRRSEIAEIEAIRLLPNVRSRFIHGEAIQDIMTDENLETIVDFPAAPGNQEDAPFSLDSFLIADEGTTMKGEDIYNLIQEAKKKGVTVASLARNLPNVRVQTIVSEGPGVVELAPRSPRRGKGEQT
jgi:hypothetical protein